MFLIGAIDEFCTFDQLAPRVSKGLKVVLSLAARLLWDSLGPFPSYPSPLPPPSIARILSHSPGTELQAQRADKGAVSLAT